MKKFMILGSGIALGVYVPALKIKKQLEEKSYRADFVCLEDLYSDKNDVIEQTKKSYHENFRLAKVSYRIPTRNKSAVDLDKKAELIERMSYERYDKVILVSGFFTDIVQELMELCPYYKGRIYALHMDAEYSLSWKNAAREGINEIWLYSLADKEVYYSLENVKINSDRCNRILVHGGGWGIGEYREKIEKLNELGFKLDIVVYYPDEVNADDTQNDYYLLDPEWKQNKSIWEFPRLLKYENGQFVEFCSCPDKINPLSQLIEKDLAVLSKPGGGTLVDSIDTATPLVFSEELAFYEKSNMKLWTYKGFGIPYDELIKAENPLNTINELRKHIEDSSRDLECVVNLF